MRTKIKKKGQLYSFLAGEREKKIPLITIRLLYAVTLNTIRKRTWWRFQRYDERSCLSTRWCRTQRSNDMDPTHLPADNKHVPIALLNKN